MEYNLFRNIFNPNGILSLFINQTQGDAVPPHTSRTLKALYRMYLMCHHGRSRCDGHAVWTFVSTTCSFDHRISVWCLYRWHSRSRVDSYIDERLYVTLRYTFRSYCACGECSSLWLHLTM